MMSKFASATITLEATLSSATRTRAFSAACALSRFDLLAQLALHLIERAQHSRHLIVAARGDRVVVVAAGNRAED